MDKKKLILTIILIVIVLGSLTAFFYPKPRAIGGLGGFIGEGEISYKEEYSCFGIKRDLCHPWPDAPCENLCYGIPYNKKCFNEVYETYSGIQKTETACR